MNFKMATIAFSSLFVVGCSGPFPPTPEPSDGNGDGAETQKPIGLVQLIEFEDIQGLRNWEYQLQKRGLKALVYIQANMLEEYAVDIRRLADEGHEIGGGYALEALWDVPYDEQLEIMQETKALVESVTEKPMRVFGSRYFASDENTLKAADALDVEYVLARGTSDVEALVYEPDEYHCKIISVSNVTFEDMGRGSLCDYSLWARGSTAEEFGQVLEDSLARCPKRLMIVSHAYLGGMKEAWWEVYEAFLDSGEVEWTSSLDDWVKPESGVNLKVPISMVPENREVKYTIPTPSVPLEELENVDEMYNPCAVP